MRAYTLPVFVLLAVSGAAAQTMPAGEYSITVSGFGAPQVHTQCMAEQSADRAVEPPAGALKDCTKRDFTKTATGMTMEIVCKSMSIKGSGTFTEGGYRSDMTISAEGMPPTRVITEVKRIGPCKPGQTPLQPPSRR